MNWASSKDGAMLVDVSSELEGCPASNVLNDDLSTIWLSEEGFPQWLCISLAKFENVPNLVIRTVGWNCWHPYITNPKNVSMHVSSDGSKFKVWDSFEVPQRTRGTQLFSCAPVDTSMYPYIALEVARTFGGSQTYMNRVFLYSDEIAASPTSSKDGRSIVDNDEHEVQQEYALLNSHSNNMSDLSARTPERIPSAGRMSHDTVHLVEQLQDALGLHNTHDDSYYYSDDLKDDHRVFPTAGRNMSTSTQLPVEESPGTVAGRLSSLEHTVHALEHTLLGHSLHPTASSAPNVSFARSPTPPSRSHSHSNNQSPSASHTSNVSSSSSRRHHRSPSRSPRGDLTDEQRVAVVAGRLDSIEEKLTRFMDTFEKRATAQPPRPPPPPAPPLPPVLPSPFPWSESPSVHSSLRSSSHRSPHDRSQTQQRVTQSTTSLSNATLSTKSRSLPGKTPVAPQYPSAYTSSASPTRTRPAAAADGAAVGAERVMEQVVHSVETMMQRVLAQHELKHSSRRSRMRSTDSTINSSSLFETPEDVSHKSQVARSRSRSRSRSTSTSRRDNHGGRERNRSPASSSEEQPNEKRNKKKEGFENYISENAKRLLRRKSEKADVETRMLREAKEAVAARRELETVHNYPQNLINRVEPRSVQSGSGKHSGRDHGDSSVLSSSSDDDDVTRSRSTRRGRHHYLRQHRGEDALLLDEKESHNILERSIFELLKSKYGLGVSNEAEQERRTGGEAVSREMSPLVANPALNTLPMRVPAAASSLEGPVVDWPQYVQNRVAISSGVGSTSSRLASPLRQRHAGVYSVAGVVVNSAEHGDVLPRAKQHMRNRERSVSPLRTGLLAPTFISTPAEGATPGASHCWWERDAEMAELVRTLHEKVYQRTVKEAQYDMLLCAAENNNK